MFEMPNPFTDTAASVSRLAAATAASLPQPPSEAAGSFDEPTAAHGGDEQESPAVVALNPHEAAGTFDLDADDLITEIFIGALKLDRRFVLDVDRFMLDIEEMPLFLRDVG